MKADGSREQRRVERRSRGGGGGGGRGGGARVKGEAGHSSSVERGGGTRTPHADATGAEAPTTPQGSRAPTEHKGSPPIPASRKRDKSI
jgi:hypothetical protein